MLINDFEKALREECGVRQDDLLLAGISGGPDSLVLLDLLSQIGQPVIVAHFNHMMREGAAEDAAAVERMAAERHCPFIVESQNVLEFAEREKLSLEEAARKARYRFLYDQARKMGAVYVAVAHTADDQVETMLMHLLRGAGISGLVGMRSKVRSAEWGEDISLIRPLLRCWRQDILRYCEENHLKPVYDPSNENKAYFRNRIRHDLIPYLENFNPRVKLALWRSAQSLAADEELLLPQIDQAWNQCLVDVRPGYVILNRKSLSAQPVGLQRAVLRRAVGELRAAKRDLDFDAVERCLNFLSIPANRGQVDVVAGMVVDLEADTLVLRESKTVQINTEIPQVYPGRVESLPVPGCLEISNGWQIRVDVMHRGDAEPWKDTANPYCAWLDLEKLQFPLRVRGWKAGDRFTPFGMDGRSTKLSDFWTNAHLPKAQRNHWPIICSGDQIAWVVGMRISQLFSIGEETQHIIRFELTRADDSG
jgi:tRNA(Ile)-lysidine synthase